MPEHIVLEYTGVGIPRGQKKILIMSDGIGGTNRLQQPDAGAETLVLCKGSKFL